MSEAEDLTVLRADPSVSRSGGSRSGAAEADAPRVLKQRFVLEEKLGSGGMGTVFRAKDLRKVEARDRQPFVAVKVLNNDFREHPEAFIALQREAVKSQALSHPSIVSIFDFDKDGDVPFIIMELLEGQELADLLRAYPTGLPDEMAWNLIRGLCAGLAHAHEAGVVHADFKPGNVFVSAGNRPKILDFGIARAVQHQASLDDEPDFDPGRLGALTPAYASPEMLGGLAPEPRDDLYSLGVVIYLMLTGQHPFGRTPGDQAAQQQLKPERPGRLSRRQWRAVERCLAFARQDRPESVAELARLLLQPAPWRSRTALVAAAAVLVTLGASYLKEDAAVTEAKEEVRQVTLVDAQRARLAALLEAPRFDSPWQDKLEEEARNLMVLQGEGVMGSPLFARIRDLYGERIAGSSLPDSLALYRRGVFFGDLTPSRNLLRDRLEARMDRLLDRPVLEAGWLEELEATLSWFAALLPRSSALAELRLEVADVLEQQLIQSVEADQFPAARVALGYLQAISFDPVTLDALTREVQAAEERFVAAQTRRALDDARAGFRAELGAALDSPCMNFNLAPGAAVFERWRGRYPGFADAGLELVAARVGRCASQLEAVDQDRARALLADARSAFGPLPGLSHSVGDPCAAPYLVGNGRQPGRAGYCLDRLADETPGPRLVVLPAFDGQGQFAISKHEISWSDLNRFCVETGRCSPEAGEQMPVAGVPLALAQQYAVWLSEQTGQRYRLPTRSEWLHAAQGEADPNRNCQMQLGSVSRGLAPVAVESGAPNRFGLVNVLGNVQEWVVAEGQMLAMGGAYSDPIAECAPQTSRRHAGDPDVTTGFRLVREIT